MTLLVQLFAVLRNHPVYEYNKRTKRGRRKKKTLLITEVSFSIRIVQQHDSKYMYISSPQLPNILFSETIWHLTIIRASAASDEKCAC